jgi:hypothetical protein
MANRLGWLKIALKRIQRKIRNKNIENNAISNQKSKLEAKIIRIKR